MLSGLDQWIDYIRYSLADIVVRGEWDDFGIFRFLNRISFMSRNPLIFLIHHEETPGEFIVDREVSIFDPLFKVPFDQVLKERNFVEKSTVINFFDREARRQLKPDALKNYGIRIFNTKNSVIAFQLKITKSDRPGDPPRTTFCPIAKTSEIGRFLVRVLLPFDGKKGRMSLLDDIESHFSELRQSGSYKKADDIPPEKQNITSEDIGWANVSYESVTHLVDKEFRRLTKSPLLRSFFSTSGLFDLSDNNPVNVAFFSKVFSRDTSRCRAYFYDSVFVMSDNQTKRIRSGLQQAKPEHFIQYASATQNNQFWSMQASSEGRDQIISILRSPLPKNVRLFNENALMSGIMMIAPNVFREGGVGWIEGKVQRHERDTSLLHLACLHYALQFCAPDLPSETPNLSIVSLPFRCSGGIWMCASFLRNDKVQKNDKNQKVSKLVDQDVFETSYCIYHSLLRESERRLRRNAKFAYIKLIGKLAAFYAIDTRERHGLRRDVSKFDHEAIDSFNLMSKNLARAYPFPRYELEPSSGKGHGGFMSPNEVSVKECKNPFFDRLSLRSFIEKEDIEREIASCVMLEA